MVSFISLTHASQGHTTLSVLTYNCYGLKGSLNYVKELMNTNDVIFLNEHWLMDSDILVIKAIISEYYVYMKSSMDCESNACGRPFGGIGFICKQKAGVRYAPVQYTSDRLMGLHVYVGKSNREHSWKHALPRDWGYECRITIRARSGEELGQVQALQ